MKICAADFQHQTCMQDLAQSLHHTGFAILSNPPIQPSVLKTAYQEWQSFFGSSHKSDYVYDSTNLFGYYPFKSENAKGYTQKDLKEFFMHYPWGAKVQGISGATQELFESMLALAQMVLKGIAAYIPENHKTHWQVPLESLCQQDGRRNALRIIHYPPIIGASHDGAERAAPHGDINFITLLPGATASGLQVKDTLGQWHALDCNPNAMVINAGDMLERYSRGYIKSTIHRVINPIGAQQAQSRYSMPLFVHPPDELQLCSEYTAGKFLQQRLAENGLVAEKIQTDPSPVQHQTQQHV